MSLSRKLIRREAELSEHQDARKRLTFYRALGTLTSFPQNHKVKLKYHTNGSFACTTGAVGVYGFKLNSCYDPDYTSTGHQPLGFDQWATFYQTYIVSAAQVRVKMLNYSAYQAVIGFLPDENANPSTVLDTLCEQPMAYHYLQFAQNPPYIDSPVFTKKYSMASWFQVKTVEDDVARFGAKTTSDPTNLMYWYMFGRDLSGSGTVTVYFDVEIEQTVIFSEPKDLTQS